MKNWTRNRNTSKRYPKINKCEHLFVYHEINQTMLKKIEFRSSHKYQMMLIRSKKRRWKPCEKSWILFKFSGSALAQGKYFIHTADLIFWCSSSTEYKKLQSTILCKFFREFRIKFYDFLHWPYLFSHKNYDSAKVESCTIITWLLCRASTQTISFSIELWTLAGK